MKYKLPLITFLLFMLLPVTTAIQVNEGVYFNTTGTGSTYYIAAGFNATNITVYNNSLNINGGNITTYSNVNISLESLTNINYLNFTNNATITNITIENGFANYSITNSKIYGLYYQLNNTKLDQTVAGTQIYFTSIQPDSWYITASDSIWSGAAATSPIKDGSTSTVTVTVSDPSSVFDTVYVKIEGTNYTMQNLGAGTYRYFYTDTLIIKKHYITDFYAHDLGGWTKISSSLYINVLASSGSGGGYVIPTPTPTLTATPTTTPTPTEPISTDHISTFTTYTDDDTIKIFKLVSWFGENTIQSTTSKPGITQCEFNEPSIVSKCEVYDGVVILTMKPFIDGVWYTAASNITIIDETGNQYETDISISTLVWWPFIILIGLFYYLITIDKTLGKILKK